MLARGYVAEGYGPDAVAHVLATLRDGQCRQVPTPCR